MKKLLLYVLAAYYGLTGLYILIAPETFYRQTPGLVEMGPYNAHFVIDVGLVFITVGVGIIYGIVRRNNSVIVFAAMWPLLHALFHMKIWGHRGFLFDTIWFSDLAGVIVPGVILAFLALTGSRKAEQ